jgi:uncharacterized tellurite resistance protein B-like protein
MGEAILRLKLAFGVSIGRAIVDADRQVDYSEFRLFGQIFPRVLLREEGFVDEQGQFTEALATAWMEACAVLPEMLSEEDKLDLLSLFHGTSMADGTRDSRETRVIKDAADLLGVPSDVLAAHLAD